MFAEDYGTAHDLLTDLALRRMAARGRTSVEVRMGLVERVTIGESEIRSNVLYASAASVALDGPDLMLASAIVATLLAARQCLAGILHLACTEQRYDYSAFAYARQAGRAGRIILALQNGTPITFCSLRGLL